jgi:serine phosphatase RsbU (regulator of sigma subunit)
MKIKTYLYYLFSCFLVFCLYPLASFGQIIDISSIKDRQNIDPQISYFADIEGKMSVEEITQSAVQEKFIISDKDMLNLGINDNIYWLKIDVQTDDTPSDYLLEVSFPFMRQVDFYYQKNNTWQNIKNGYDVNREDKLIKKPYPTFSLKELPKSSSQTVYLKIRNNGMQIPIHIYQKNYFDSFYFVKNILYGIFVGLLLFVIINNMYLYFFFREKTYLYYVILVTSYVIFAGAYEGYFQLLFKDIPFLYHNYLGFTTVIGTLSYALVPIYTIHFFEFDKKDSIRKVNIVFQIYILITLPLCIFPHYAAFNNEVVAFVGLVITVVISFRARQRKLSGSIYFLVAYFSYLIFASLEIFTIQVGIPYVFRLSYLSVGILVEVIVLALALSKKFEDKQNQLREEREKARLENLRLVEGQNIMLEKKVNEKTQDLQESYEEISQTNEELQQTHEELVMLNETLSTTYTKLKTTTERMDSSIRYAQNMQKIILPSEEEILSYFKDYFAIYLPKDIVSGDFYWCLQISETKTVFALADCTGHGVPGAFMTMIGNTLLHEVVDVKGITSPAHILKELDLSIQSTLKQNRSNNKDGMDISVCLFEKREEDTLMTIASAKCKTYYKLSNGELEEFSGDKIYMGGKTRKNRKKEFTNLEVSLQKDNIIYFTTDGFADQNDKERRRFGVRELKDLLQGIMDQPLEKQKEELVKALTEHQGTEEQRDDITLVAIKI